MVVARQKRLGLRPVRFLFETGDPVDGQVVNPVDQIALLDVPVASVRRIGLDAERDQVALPGHDGGDLQGQAETDRILDDVIGVQRGHDAVRIEALQVQRRQADARGGAAPLRLDDDAGGGIAGICSRTSGA